MTNLPRKVILVRSHDDEATKTGQERQACARPGGLKGVVKVPSLLFDIELEDTVSEELPDDEVEDVVAQVQALLKPRSQLEKQLSEEVHQLQQDLVGDGTKIEASHIARKIRLPGYVFKTRTALGGNCAGSCLRQLRHFFLTCSSTDSPQTVSCVVDPQFREQFEIANPSTRYLKVLAAVPHVVVLSEERLLNLVNLLSHEIQQSFQVTGSTLPPWRQSASMMSKWRPRRSEDVVITPNSPLSTTAYKRLPEFKAGKIIVPKLEAFSSSKEKSTSNGTDKAGGVRPHVRTGFSSSSSGQDRTTAMPGKRGRDQGQAGLAYASLLASKLRGVTSFEGGDRIPSLFSNTGQA